MERDDIIRMAKEAGFELDCCSLEWHSRIRRFAALVAAEKDKQIAFLKDSHDAIRELAYKTGAEEEREACAQIVEREALAYAEPVWAVEIVNDIRARGEA